MNRAIAQTLKSAVWLTVTGTSIAFSANAATSAQDLNYWAYSDVSGYVTSQIKSQILGNSSIRFDGPGNSTGINELASAKWDIPAGVDALDPSYNLVTNYGEYGYSYTGQAKVQGNALKASIATTSSDWENANPNGTRIQAYAQAYFGDQWLIAPTKNHASGSYGAALVKITLDGSLPAQSSGYNSAYASLYASTTFTDVSGVGYQSYFSISADNYGYYTSGTNGSTAYDSSTPGTISLTKKLLFQYGTVFNLNMSLSASSSGNGQADFFNTGKISEVFLPFEAQLQTGSLSSGVDGVSFGRVLNASSLDDPNTNWDFGSGGGPIIPSVPEPEAYAMLLAGLGLMACIARRRAQRP